MLLKDRSRMQNQKGIKCYCQLFHCKKSQQKPEVFIKRFNQSQRQLKDGHKTGDINPNVIVQKHSLKKHRRYMSNNLNNVEIIRQQSKCLNQTTLQTQLMTRVQSSTLAKTATNSTHAFNSCFSSNYFQSQPIKQQNNIFGRFQFNEIQIEQVSQTNKKTKKQEQCQISLIEKTVNAIKQTSQLSSSNDEKKYKSFPVLLLKNSSNGSLLLQNYLSLQHLQSQRQSPTNQRLAVSNCLEIKLKYPRYHKMSDLRFKDTESINSANSSSKSHSEVLSDSSNNNEDHNISSLIISKMKKFQSTCPKFSKFR